MDEALKSSSIDSLIAAEDTDSLQIRFDQVDSSLLQIRTELQESKELLVLAKQQNSSPIFGNASSYTLLFAVLVLIATSIIQYLAARRTASAHIRAAETLRDAQIKVSEVQAETQTAIARKQLEEQANENGRRRSDQITFAEDAAKLQRQIAKSQLVAEVIAKSRHEWIQRLREEVSGVIADAATLARSSSLSDKDKSDLSQSANTHKFRIELLLHAGEPNHDKLIALLKENVRIVGIRMGSSGGEEEKKLQENVGQITEVSSHIMKEAWDTLKEEVRTGRIK